MRRHFRRFFSRNIKINVKIPASYSVKILSNTTKLTLIDKRFVKIILNFLPNLTNFRCEIDRFDNYVDYMENVRAFICCEVTKDNWNDLGSNLIELEKYIKYEKERDIDDFRSFLHLVEIGEDNDIHITNHELVEKTINFINTSKRGYQSKCTFNSKIYISSFCSVNDYKIIWGNENYLNLIMESYG